MHFAKSVSPLNSQRLQRICIQIQTMERCNQFLKFLIPKIQAVIRHTHRGHERVALMVSEFSQWRQMTRASARIQWRNVGCDRTTKGFIP